ncbi:MAG: type II toxin-antitoxin system VapC family toxin [Rhizomicrobium sp.]
MRLLADTHILIALAERTVLPGRLMKAMMDADNALFASVASLWEIAIKVRLGKLPLTRPLDAFPGFLERARFSVIDISADHALALAQPEPPTRDPFDRLLLAQCQVEGLRLVTVDRALAAHPLAWRET